MTTPTPNQPERPDQITPGIARELVISHTFAEGTILDGTRKTDDLYPMLRSHGWNYRRTMGDFRLQGSVDKPAKSYAIQRTVESLRERGFAVRVEIDNTVRSMDEAETDRADRAEARADRLDARADRLRRAAAARHAAAHQVLDNIPLGQPYLVDHSGYAADRNRRERAFTNLDKSVELDRQAEDTQRRAETAHSHMDARHAPETVVNRITALETELRAIDREREQGALFAKLASQGVPSDRIPVSLHALTPERDTALTDRTAYLAEQLRHWTAVRERQVAEGTATHYQRGDIARGDLIQRRGLWYPVVRVNPKSVSIPSIVGGSWTDTVRYEHIDDHVRPNDERWNAIAEAAVCTAEIMGRRDALHPAFQALRPAP